MDRWIEGLITILSEWTNSAKHANISSEFLDLVIIHPPQIVFFLELSSQLLHLLFVLYHFCCVFQLKRSELFFVRLYLPVFLLIIKNNFASVMVIGK